MHRILELDEVLRGDLIQSLYFSDETTQLKGILFFQILITSNRARLNAQFPKSLLSVSFTSLFGSSLSFICYSARYQIPLTLLSELLLGLSFSFATSLV